MDGTQKLVKHVLRGYRAGSGFTVMVSPIVWDIPPGSDQRRWYFIVASGRIDVEIGKGRHYAIDQIVVNGGEGAAGEARSQFLAALVAGKRPIVAHSFDDELEMAKWAAAAWPGPKSEGILRGIQAERAALAPELPR